MHLRAVGDVIYKLRFNGKNNDYMATGTRTVEQYLVFIQSKLRQLSNILMGYPVLPRGVLILPSDDIHVGHFSTEAILVKTNK